MRALALAALLVLVPRPASAQTVRDILHAGQCSRPFEAHGLSTQIAATHACRFGSIQPFTPSGNVSVSSFGAPGFIAYGTPAMIGGLFRAGASRHLYLNAAYRTIIDQYLTIVRHGDGTCGGHPATMPGGPHVSGCAVDMDVSRARAAQGDMSRAGFDYWGSADPVHFSYRGCSGANGVAGPTNYDDVRAFQLLWNANHPEAQVAVDGNFNNALGPLLDSPANGFPHDGCRPDHDGDGSPEGEDCDDYDPHNRPGGQEDCDGRDNDCDTRIDESVTRVCGTDVGECRTGIETCTNVAWGPCVGEIAPVDETCNELDDDCNGAADDARVCEHESSRDAQIAYAQSSSDFDGNGTMDACMRTPAGFECIESESAGFRHLVRGPTLADEDGWDHAAQYATLRMGDVDGDGASDLCLRQGDRLVCSSLVRSSDRSVSIALGPISPGTPSPEIWLADVDGDHIDDPCVRDTAGLRCNGSRAGTLALGAVSDAAGFEDVTRHGTIRFGDVDGDGRADVCARLADGVACWIADPHGFSRQISGPRWSDAAGWSDVVRWSTIRLADVDADGRADLCARGPDGFRCATTLATPFDRGFEGPALADGDGWDQRSQYATLRMGDVDGDGAADLCGRASDGITCWLAGAGAFDVEIRGPRLSDEAGWHASARFETLRLADVDGDRRADLCARDADGLRCWTSDATPFDRMRILPAWNDVAGLSDPSYATTLVISGLHVAPSAQHLDGTCACRAGARSSSRLATGALTILLIVLGHRSRSRRR